VTRHQKIAALHLTVALGSVEAVMQTEGKGSARYRKLDNLIAHINRVVDVYRVESFQYQDMCNGGAIIDSVNEQIEKMYGENHV